MKHFNLTAWLLLLCLPAVVSPAWGRPKWKLVWKEDFKGKTIDESVWSRVPKGPSDWDDMMSLRPDLAYVEKGQLVLLGKADGTSFVTGGICSAGKKSFRLARFEIRAKFNHAQGFWPALWLMPDTPLQSPDYAEIDIMEHVNFESIVHQTVHSHFTLHLDKEKTLPQSIEAKFKADDWNTYAAEVHEDSICFFVNDRKTLTYPRLQEKEYQFPWADCPFYIILSNQLGGHWVGPISKPEQLPSELRIDWIKVYEKR